MEYCCQWTARGRGRSRSGGGMVDAGRSSNSLHGSDSVRSGIGHEELKKPKHVMQVRFLPAPYAIMRR
jgi:hypothetical protein